MGTLNRLAATGAGAGAVAGLVLAAGPAGATTTAAASPPAAHGCTMTVTHPATIYRHASFTGGRVGYGKHTGDPVTSSWDCPFFLSGFMQVRLAAGGTGYIYASDLGSPRPVYQLGSYRVTADVNVRAAPSTTYGRVLKVKHAGDVVASPVAPGTFNNNGFAEVLTSKGDIAWMSRDYLR